MRETRIIMGMPIDVAVADERRPPAASGGRVRGICRGRCPVQPFQARQRRLAVSIAARSHESEFTPRMREIAALCEKTRRETGGYFDIDRPDGTIDPCGMVKGWAIRNAAAAARARWATPTTASRRAATSSATAVNDEGTDWTVGIRNPFMRDEIIKVLEPRGQGVATSGNYIRGAHIYDPHTRPRTDRTISSASR